MNQVKPLLISSVLLLCTQVLAQSNFQDEENYSEYEKELIYLESLAVKKEAEELERAEKVTDQALEQEEASGIIQDSVSTSFAAPERTEEAKTSSSKSTTMKRRIRSR